MLKMERYILAFDLLNNDKGGNIKINGLLGDCFVFIQSTIALMTNKRKTRHSVQPNSQGRGVYPSLFTFNSSFGAEGTAKGITGCWYITAGRFDCWLVVC